jgi:hypothetical protein
MSQPQVHSPGLIWYFKVAGKDEASYWYDTGMKSATDWHANQFAGSAKRLAIRVVALSLFYYYFTVEAISTFLPLKYHVVE